MFATTAYDGLITCLKDTAANLTAFHGLEKALKLPSPNPSSSLRSMNSKKTGP